MNSLSIRKFTLNGQCLWVYYLFRVLTMNWLSFSRIHYGLTIIFEIWLWIHYQIINSTISSLSLTYSRRINYLFANSLWISLWIHYWFPDLTLNSLSILRFDFKFTFFANALSIFFSFLKELWTHHIFRNLTLN